jgi:hypothetical protein
MLCTFATTEIEAYFVDACVIHNDKVVAMGGNWHSAAFTNPMPELYTKPKCLKSRRFEESTIPVL